MITKEKVSKLTSEEKDKIILKLISQIQALEARIVELEAKLSQRKTSKNSSIPPSRDQKKISLEERKEAPGKRVSAGLVMLGPCTLIQMKPWNQNLRIVLNAGKILAKKTNSFVLNMIRLKSLSSAQK